MQNRVEFNPEIAQPFGSKTVAALKTFEKYPLRTFYFCFRINTEQVLLESKITVERVMRTV